VEYLTSLMWDKQYGGFFWGVDNKGQISPSYTDGKHLYDGRALMNVSERLKKLAAN
jgi:hypothetical protein